MFNKKKVVFGCLFFLVIISMFGLVSAKPQIITEFIGDKNLVVEANVMEYYQIDNPAQVFIHVFNKSSGEMLDNTTVDCNVELTDYNGTLVLSGIPSFDEHHWVMSRPANIVTERGEYALLIHCNATDTDGYKTFFFEANGFGDGLDVAHSIKFNASMFFMLIFLLMAIIGCV